MRRRSTTRSPPRCCATATSPTRRRQPGRAGGQPHPRERVRPALAMLEGIRDGQSLGGPARLPARARPARPPRARRGRRVHLRRCARRSRCAATGSLTTATDDGDVPDRGDRGAQRRRRPGAGRARRHRTGQHDLPVRHPADPRPAAATPSAAERGAAINAEVDALVDCNDAVADLALSEGVYQAVLGNYDRVASTYDATHGPASRRAGRGPHAPDRHRPHPPRRPASRAGLDPADPVDATPRARAEPALNRWLAGLLRPTGLGVRVVTTRPGPGARAPSVTHGRPGPSADRPGRAPRRRPRARGDGRARRPHRAPPCRRRQAGPPAITGLTIRLPSRSRPRFSVFEVALVRAPCRR